MKKFMYLVLVFVSLSLLSGCGDNGSSPSSPTNTTPTATVGTLSILQDSSNNTVTLSASDADSDTLTYTVVTAPSHGTLSGTAPNLTYTPTAGYSGADSFSFKVNDGTVDSAAATVSISVNTPANTIPVAAVSTLTVNQDSSNNTVTLSASDADSDALTYTVVVVPSHGTLGGTAPNLTYTPSAAYSGADSFSFKVNDGTVDSAVATVSISVKTKVYIKKTGQTKSYDASGTEVTDNSLKDDGYYQKGIAPNYTRASDMVSDALTNLMWQDDAAVATVKKQWLTTANYNICDTNESSPACYDTSGDTATTYCTNLSLGGYTDWRLPAVAELEGIVDYGKVNPAIDTNYFNNVSSINYSSSSTYVYNKDHIWIVTSNDGATKNFAKYYKGYVRCVREGL